MPAWAMAFGGGDRVDPETGQEQPVAAGQQPRLLDWSGQGERFVQEARRRREIEAKHSPQRG